MGSNEAKGGAKTSPNTILGREKPNIKILGCIDFSCISTILGALRGYRGLWGLTPLSPGAQNPKTILQILTSRGYVPNFNRLAQKL